MKLQTLVYSHCVAHGIAVTPRNLRKNLAADQQLGYGGMVVVPVLTNPDYSPKAIIKPFKETGMRGLVCGLLPGNGPSPFEYPEQALKSLARQARFAAAFAEAGLGPPVLIGPLHTHHTKPLLADWSEDRLRQWLDSVEKLLNEFDLRALYEPLNPKEDKTLEPFQALQRAIAERKSGLHYDTGHAHARHVLTADFCNLAPKIGYFEFANVGRWPLDKPMGINFEAYAQTLADLPDDCLVGVEPFALKLIKAFELQGLCDTNVPGEQALARDAAYLQKLGVMASPLSPGPDSD